MLRCDAAPPSRSLVTGRDGDNLGARFGSKRGRRSGGFTRPGPCVGWITKCDRRNTLWWNTEHVRSFEVLETRDMLAIPPNNS
jgi:hypothetical protein